MANVATLSTEVAKLTDEVTMFKMELDAFYLMWAGALVFLMQAGFATLSAGSIRAKNVKNILLKNLLDACIGAFAFYLLGFGFAYDGDGDANGFIGAGKSNFALSGRGYDDTEQHGKGWITFFFQFTFAAAAATIVSGAVAERCQLVAYLIYSFCITGFIYPVVVHWVWDGAGFLSAFNADSDKVILTGVIDFAGSGVVHMTGGFAALVGAKILGPRLGRFDRPEDFEGHSTPLQIIGTFLLWFGWYGFNPGSTLGINGYGSIMARAAVTTTLAAAAAGVSGLFIKKNLPAKLGGSGVYDVGHTCNSILGGLVGITAGCQCISVHGAFATGVISAFVYHGGSCLSRKCGVDDPLDAFAVHGACGFWGVMAVAFFAVHEYSYAPNTGNPAYAEHGKYDAGAFTGKAYGLLFGTQLVALILEILWVGILSGGMFFLLKKLGLLRVPKDVEVAGLDDSKHGGKAYQTESTKA